MQLWSLYARLKGEHIYSLSVTPCFTSPAPIKHVKHVIYKSGKKRVT